MDVRTLSKAVGVAAPGFEVGCKLVTLWTGKGIGVYLTHHHQSLIVRHGPNLLDAGEVEHALDTLCMANEDIGVRSTLVDLRQAPAACTCKLCALQPSRERGILAATVGEQAELEALRSFATFDSALAFVSPRSTPHYTVPCPLGFERIVALIAHYRGELVFANYIGAVYALPELRAVYLHWSGDLAEDATFQALLSAVNTTLRLVGTGRLLVDHRHRPVLKASVITLLGQRIGASKRLKQLVSIGSFPRNTLETLSKVAPRLKLEVVESLQEVLEDSSASRARSGARRAA